MLWGIRRSFANWRNIFRRPLGRGSIYRLERLRSVARLGKNRENGKINDEKNKISVDKGIKKYEKRKLNAKNQKSYKFLNIKNILIMIVLIFTFIFVHLSGYSTKSLYFSIFIYIGVTLYLLIVERFFEKVEVEEEIKNIKNEREKEHNVFLERVKEIEDLEKNQIEHIFLKDSEDYDMKIWKIGRATSLLIGKQSPRNRVDIDVSEGIYSNLVSRAHGILNRVNGIWYYEDLGSQNGSGIERNIDKRKIKLKKNIPVKVESGDIIYLATTKILLK
ncbi:FHA domain-containing protein [Leptotrichia trevisanii]|uniref:FHA domain-containing protein n=1 Tax=Leptotrichia trevisanii TaxID=109328 RepID=A0A510L5U3_9FUSO|nr:FHA domain-containing protein [Leptotrichia trevisanii]BBM53113.1 FHA domain-containing protein [Leptotrichia trevisanii]BBM57903.1 FHA domain-containing protein [Leptotrichia trevisanii]